MNRILFFALSIFLLVGACSGTTEQLTEEPSEPEPEERAFPSWFQNSTEILKDSVSYYAGATAIDSDSVRAISKAENQARAEFVAGLSKTLENIRQTAIAEGEGTSGLSDRSFIIALRNSETDVSRELAVSNSAVERKENYSSYRGFVELSISKKSLLDALDASLSEQSANWQAMKSVEAFSEF